MFWYSSLILILPAICSIVVLISTKVCVLYASLATIISPLLVKRLHPWKHFFVKKLIFLLGLLTDSIWYSPNSLLFLILSAQHIFTSSGFSFNVSAICLILVTELIKIYSSSTLLTLPFMSGSDMPSSKNICMNLASPLVNCVTLYLIGVIFVTPFHWTL